MGEETSTSPVFSDILDLTIEMRVQGNGRPILFLHPEIGFLSAKPALDGLAGLGRVLAPSHPGFGRSALPPAITTVDDLAYFYLDLLDSWNLHGTVLVGVSFGAWIAAEIAVKSTTRLAALVLASPVGIKTGGRDERDMPDLFALPRAEADAALFADSANIPDPARFTDAEVETYCRNREALALFAWSPYMHDPKLLGRLHRVGVPTLVLAGGADRFTPTRYADAFAAAIPGARRADIAAAGHFIHIEAPSPFVAEIGAFIGDSGRLSAAARG